MRTRRASKDDWSRAGYVLREASPAAPLLRTKQDCQGGRHLQNAVVDRIGRDQRSRLQYPSASRKTPIFEPTSKIRRAAAGRPFALSQRTHVPRLRAATQKSRGPGGTAFLRHPHRWPQEACGPRRMTPIPAFPPEPGASCGQGRRGSSMQGRPNRPAFAASWHAPTRTPGSTWPGSQPIFGDRGHRDRIEGGVIDFGKRAVLERIQSCLNLLTQERELEGVGLQTLLQGTNGVAYRLARVLIPARTER